MLAWFKSVLVIAESALKTVESKSFFKTLGEFAE